MNKVRTLLVLKLTIHAICLISCKCVLKDFCSRLFGIIHGPFGITLSHRFRLLSGSCIASYSGSYRRLIKNLRQYARETFFFNYFESLKSHAVWDSTICFFGTESCFSFLSPAAWRKGDIVITRVVRPAVRPSVRPAGWASTFIAVSAITHKLFAISI